MKRKKIIKRSFLKVVTLLFITINFIACVKPSPSHTSHATKRTGTSKPDSSSSEDTDAAEVLPQLLHH